MNQSRFKNLDVLRAVAALAVCFFHFRKTEIESLNAVYPLFDYGYLGVDVFFVISGFVIPLMLSKMKFQLADLPTFLSSRFLRLYPAYFCTALLSVGLWYFSTMMPGFRGQAPSVSIQEVICNLLLNCDFTQTKWMLPVFWTLAIEAQYYLLIALSYSFLFHEDHKKRLMMMAAWIVAPLVVGHGPTVLTWSALFAVGILCYQKWTSEIKNSVFWIFFCLASFSHGWTKEPISAGVGAATGLAILYLPEIRSRFLVWVGGISYSLYLLHTLIGGRVMNLTIRLPDQPIIQVGALILAIALSIAASVVFFRFVERPSHEWSRRRKKHLSKDD